MVSRASRLQCWRGSTVPCMGMAQPRLALVRLFPRQGKRKLGCNASCLFSTEISSTYACSGKTARGKDKPKQLLCSAFYATSSSASSKM